jgi:genome maintenance exonuclease 1
MITPRFKYVPLTRESIDGRRYYNCPGNQKLPSVTTILESTKTTSEKESLENWRKRVGHERANQITTEAAGRGTRQGKFLETYILTDDTGKPGSNPHSILAHKMAKVIIENGLSKVHEFYGTESGLWYDGMYAGSTDCIAMIDDEIVIIDFKQSNKLKKDIYLNSYKCQLVAYAESHNKMFGTEISRGIDMICTPDLQYQEIEISGDEYKKYQEMWWEKVVKYDSR